MKVDILGSRGSTPAPGSEFVRYGGDTSCVAISVNESSPRLVLDAGTGLRHLGRLLPERNVYEGSILLTHLHWDHTHGLPFCPPIDKQDSRVCLLMPQQDGEPGDVLGRAMSPPNFPITPYQLNGDWEFGYITEGAHEVEGFKVAATEVRHKGGRTLGFRVADSSSSIAYIPDHSVGDQGALDLAMGVDLLIHDGQYTVEEQQRRASYGHCSVEEAVEFAEKAGVGRLLLFHHDFKRTDTELDSLGAELRLKELPIEVAYDGSTYRIGRT